MSKQATLSRPLEPRLPSPAAPRSPEREGLGLAIARRDKVRRELEAVNSALEGFWEKKATAKEAIAAAEAVVETAKADAAHYLIKSTFGDAPTPPLMPREARAALAEAQDALQVLEEAHDTVRAMKEDLERQFLRCDGQVNEARSAVVRSDPRTLALAERYQAALAEFASLRDAVSMMGAHLPIRPTFLPGPQGWPRTNSDMRWRAAVDALETDPDAELPTL